MIAIFQEDFLESFRSIFVLLWVWSILPGIFATGSNLALEKIEFEFKAFRLQQYEYGDKLFGSKSWKVCFILNFYLFPIYFQFILDSVRGRFTQRNSSA
jgi:flagellar biosynthesis protein FlhB